MKSKHRFLTNKRQFECSRKMVLKRASRPSESSAPPPAPPTSSNAPVWTAEAELSLFSALIQHKVAGPSKHFQMALVTEKVNQGKPKKRPKILGLIPFEMNNYKQKRKRSKKS